LRKLVSHLSIIKPTQRYSINLVSGEEFLQLIKGEKTLSFKYTFILPDIGIINCEQDNYETLKSIITGEEFETHKDPIYNALLESITAGEGFKKIEEDITIPLKISEISTFIDGRYAIYSPKQSEAPLMSFPGENNPVEIKETFVSWEKMKTALSLLERGNIAAGSKSLVEIFRTAKQNEASLTALLTYINLNLRENINPHLSRERVVLLISKTLHIIQNPHLINFSQLLKDGDTTSVKDIKNKDILLLSEISGKSIFEDPIAMANEIGSIGSTNHFGEGLPAHFLYRYFFIEDIKNFGKDRELLKAYYLKQGFFTLHRIFSAMERVERYSKAFNNIK